MSRYPAKKDSSCHVNDRPRRWRRCMSGAQATIRAPGFVDYNEGGVSPFSRVPSLALYR